MTLPDEPYFELTEERLIWLYQTLGLNALSFVYYACHFADDIKTFCLHHGLSRAAFYRACKELNELEDFEVPIQIREIRGGRGLERIIRDRLHQELGGLIEVITPIGRIDLLTDTEIIEVKRYLDWKSAFGQLLAYSAFYPEHQKRLHLFAESRAAELSADVLTICGSMNVLVTFETIQGATSDA